MLNAKRICQTYNRLVDHRGNWETYWGYVTQYCLPNLSDYITKRVEGDTTRANQIYDATAVRAARLLATSIIGAIFTGRWFSLKFRNDTIQEDTINEWLEEVETLMLAAFEDSNFFVQVGQSITGLVTAGTSGLSVEETSNDNIFDSLVFQDHHLTNFVFDEGSDGLPNRVYRKVTMSAAAAYDMYSQREDVPAELIEYLEKEYKKKDDPKVEFIEAHEPSTLFDYDPEMGRYKSTIVLKTLEMEVSSEYVDDLPMLVSRWDKITGDRYGWSPAMGALPDIITLNEAKRLELGAWEKNILPPKEVLVGTLFNGEINRSANGYTLVNRANSIKNMDEPYNFQLTVLKSDELKEAIKYAFHEQELILPDRNHDTATEVTIRYELMQRLLGATFGRIKSELLQPLINRVFRLMLDGGAFPPIPEGITGEIDVEYQSPLAKSQRSADLQTIERLVMFAGQLSQAKQNPTLMLAIDDYEALKSYDRGLGTPPLVLKDKEAYEQAVQEMQEQQQKLAEEQRNHEMSLRQEQQPNEEEEEQPIAAPTEDTEPA